MAKILHISDWHCNAREAMNTLRLVKESQIGPDPDFVIVTGDMVENRYHMVSPSLEAEEQEMVWQDILAAISRTFPGCQVAAVAGNHEFCTYGTTGSMSKSIADSRLTFTMNTLGYDARQIVFTGFRGVPEWRNQWDREYKEKDIAEILELCDPKADILITHTPAYGLLDMTRRGVAAGSKALRKWLKNSKVKIHCFGHIHEAAGTQTFYRNKKDPGTVCSNAALGWNWLNLP